MSRRQLPRGTAAQLNAATFLPGEIAVDTTNDELRYDGDGSTVGGIALARKDGTNISVTSTGSTTERSLADRFAEFANVKDFGALGDGSTDDTTAIQAAHDYVAELGGGTVWFPDGTYVHGLITQKSLVVFEGEGWSTCLKAKTNLNGPLIKSYNFDTLTGGGAWLVSAGVQHGLGLRNLRIDGNKANQSSFTGAGLVCYFAKRIFVDNVVIHDAKSVGWYSEGGDVASQTDYTDLPESQIEGLWVRNCGSHGFQFRGPHDAHIEGLCANANGGDGVRFERSVGVYSGAADIGFIHSYANTARGVFIDQYSQIRGRQIISESNYQEGIVIDGWFNQISMLQLYTNCRTSGSYSGTLTGSNNTITGLQVKDAGESVGGFQITGTNNVVSGIVMNGENSTGVGLDLNGARNRVEGHIEEYDGTAAIGLRTGNTAAVTDSYINLTIWDCKTLWSNGASAANNKVIINGRAETGQTILSGTTAPAASEHWLVSAYDTDTTSYKIYSGGQFESRSASAGALTLTNSADNANVQVGVFEGKRPTAATDDIAYHSFKLKNATGAQVEFGRFSWRGTDITNASEDGQLFWSLVINSVLTTMLRLNGNALFPASAGLITLGQVTLPFGNIFSNGYLTIGDNVTAPSATSGLAKIYVDTADGDLKVIFGDGTIKTIVVDT